MRRPEPPLERTLTPDEPWAFDVPVASGECLRLVAATATPAGLNVRTRGIASVTSNGSAGEGWLVARRKGPLCANEATTVRVEITSHAGGKAAVGRWFLPP